jgi:hypothetical protein
MSPTSGRGDHIAGDRHDRGRQLAQRLGLAAQGLVLRLQPREQALALVLGGAAGGVGVVLVGRVEDHTLPAGAAVGLAGREGAGVQPFNFFPVGEHDATFPAKRGQVPGRGGDGRLKARQVLGVDDLEAVADVGQQLGGGQAVDLLAALADEREAGLAGRRERPLVEHHGDAVDDGAQQSELALHLAEAERPRRVLRG